MNTHNKTSTAKNQQQHSQNQAQHMAADDQMETQQVYALQVIDDHSQMDGDSATEGDITEYLTHANIITKEEDGATSESEGQLLLYDVDVLDTIKGPGVKRKFVTSKDGELHEIHIADSDPIELLTFEDDELEWRMNGMKQIVTKPLGKTYFILDYI